MKKLSLAVAVALFAGNAFAAALLSPQQATFTVSTHIRASCSISAGDLAFPDYDPMDTSDTVGTSTITLTCSKNSAYTVTLSSGGSPSYAARRMTGATHGDLLSYNLYTASPPSTNVWGDATAPAANKVTGNAPDKNAFGLTVYGSIPAGQDMSVDTYTDSITAEVTF